MKNITIKLLGSAALAIVSFNSCDEAFLDKQNPNQLSTNTFFKNENDATAAVNSSYAALQNTDLYKRLYFFMEDLASDEVKGNDPLYADGQQISAYTFNASNSTFADVWRGLYRGVHRCNFALAGLSKLPESDVTRRLEGETRFLRALYYFELVANWGDVPIRKEPYSTSAPSPKRSPAAEVWAFIEEDLTAAAGLLPVTPAETGRAAQGSAQALLGKTYLYQKKFAQAAAEFKKVIDGGKYDLMPNYADNFVEKNNSGEYVEFNKESLFEVSFAGPENTGTYNNWGDDNSGSSEGTFRAIEYGITAFQNTSPSTVMVNAYPDSDPRKRQNMFGPGSQWYLSGEGMVAYPRDDWQHRKYSTLVNANSRGDDINSYAGSGTNMRVIRFADVLLMYAEALNEQGGKFSPEARDAVNRVRSRVGLPGIAAADGPGLFQAIINERRLELAFEQHRRKDIVRWGIARDVLGVKFITGKHEVFPIPQIEIDINPELTQNNGY